MRIILCTMLCKAVYAQAPGRSLSDLEAWMVRTSSSQSTNHADCHRVKVDTDATDTLKSSWTWTHMGQHEVSTASCMLCLPKTTANTCDVHVQASRHSSTFRLQSFLGHTKQVLNLPTMQLLVALTNTARTALLDPTSTGLFVYNTCYMPLCNTKKSARYIPNPKRYSLSTSTDFACSAPRPKCC